MSLADVTSARSSPEPDACPECDTSASVTSDLHKYQVACTCKPGSGQYARADDPGPPPPAKTDTPPALPPRPPAPLGGRRNNASVGCNNDTSCRRRKYAWWCCGCGALAAALGGLLAAQHILLRAYTASPHHLETVPAAVPAAMYAWWCCGCGALAAALGGLLAAQHILLRAYTASPHHLETVPAAVPAAMLVLTGVCIMSLARRRNRYSYMIKVVGACCLVCALTCVLVTITTTVIHMNKLQTLKFCEYTKLTRTCTCFSMPPDSQHSVDDDGVRCVFEGVTDCGVVHGALYWCLRGVFALSVSAVLVCIFSCMLAYQLLSHERKKMYWEQLELRCRSLYRPPTGQTVQTSGRPVQANCSCCAQCHPTQPAWDLSMQHRFWTPGRIGNLYSPNPGTGRKTSAWSWFPWPRSNSQNSRCRRMGGVPQSGDSAYGFCDTDTNQNPNAAQYEDRSPYPSNVPFQRNQNQASFPQNPGSFPQNSNSFPQNQGSFPQNPGSFPQNPGAFPQTPSQSAFAQSGFVQYVQEGFGEASGSFDATTGVWGPPPPYSPQGRTASRHHLHQDPAAATLLHHHHMDAHRNMPIQDHANLPMQSHACARNSYMMQHSLQQLNPELARLNPELARLNPELARLNPELARLNPEMIHLNPELAHLSPELAHLAQLYPPEELARLQAELGHVQEGRFNTLRGHLVPYRACHPRSLGMSVGNLHRDCRMEDNLTIECLHQKSASKVSDQSSDSCQKLGKENLAFTNDKNSPVRNSMRNINAESEVYFADVSSCCNVSVKNLAFTNDKNSPVRNSMRNINAESEVYFADVSSCCNVSVKADCCMNPNVSALVGTIENHPESTSESDTGSFTLTRQQRPQPQIGSKRRPRQEKHAQHLKTQEKLLNNSLRMNELNNSMRLNEQLNSSIRLTEQQIEQLNNSMRMSEQLNNSLRMSERLERNDSRDRLNERIERLSDRERDRIESREKLNESRISDRMNDSRIERMNEARMSDRMSHTRISDRANESRISDRMNDSRTSDRLNDSKISDRIEERRLSDLNSSLRMDSPLRMARSSPKGFQKEHPRQSSLDSSKEFFVAPALSPLSPKTEESLLSDDDRQDQAYSNEPESSRPKCLGPDSQYETVREEKEEVLKTNHHHCYSDTNTMDSGWQSGSEKQVTD